MANHQMEKNVFTKRICSLLALFCLLNTVHVVAQIPADSLKAFYDFNGSLNDQSGNNNHITEGSGTYATDRFGNASSAFKLDGNLDSLVLPVADFAPITGDFSLSFWYNTHSPEVMNLFSSKQFPIDTTNNFEIQLNSHNSYYLEYYKQSWYQTFIYWNGSGNTGNSVAEGAAGVFTKGSWCHMLIEREADTIRIFRNNQFYLASLNSEVTGSLGDAVNLVFGASPHRFKGVIDDLRLYKKALNQSEIDLLWFENRAFVFVEPRPTDAYVSGSDVTAYWQYDTTQVSDSILVEYRTNGGSWTPSIHTNLAYEYYTHVIMDGPPGTSYEVRVTDILNPQLTASSGTFVVSEYDWVSVSEELPFNAKDGSGLLHFNDKMWLLGGWDPPFHPPNYTHSQIWSSTDGANWTYETDASWPARHCAAWLLYDSALWVIGGDPQSGCLRDVWKSNDGIEWTQMVDTIPGYVLRHMPNYASLSDKMIIYGGEQCSGLGLNEVWQSTDGSNWTQLPNAPWSGRGMQINSCVDAEGQLWMLGGSNEGTRRSLNEVWKMSDDMNWTLINESAPWTGRYWHTTAWFDNKMWLLGGMATGTEMNDVWYSSDGVDWKELRSTTGNWPEGSRHAQSTTVYDSALWYMCGIASNNSWKLINTATASNISERNQREEIKVYPNPTNGVLQIQTRALSSHAPISIYDITGKLVFKDFLETSHQQLHIEFLDSGIYFIQMEQKPAMKFIKY